MSAIDEVVAALHSVIGELNDASRAAVAARGEVDHAVAQAVALGAINVVAGLTAVKASIDKLTQQIGAAVDVANGTIGHARAVADGT